jgi:chromosome segregation protein
MASVELIFDNTDGRIAGEFAAYNEISVKRVIGRDGVSQYSLNGARCRRKDVRDLFLGTGLGSKSYSIIEQGMISQVVDAGPEDIRSHLEEAAGISRYKERRRETERRIKHTRENLDRLSDLRDEIASHLNRLKRQANAAERYRKLKIEQRELEANLLALQWSSLQTNADAGEDFNAVQGELYSVGSEIARLEQTIQHSRELQARQRKEFDETSDALQDMEKHMVLDRAQVEDLTTRLAEVEPALEEANKAEAAADIEMQAAEAEVARWQENLEKHHAKNNELNRTADGQRATVEMLDTRMQDAASRLEQLAGETKGTDTEAMSLELVELEKQGKLVDKQLAEHQNKLKLDRNDLDLRREGLRDNTSRQHELQGEISRREGRLESLNALQQATREGAGGITWLENNGLESATRLVEELDVAEGWESATETVLGFWLDSVLVEDPGALLPGLQQLTADDGGDVELTLLGNQSTGVKANSGTLAEKVVAPDVIINLLNRVQIADTLESAFGAVATGQNGLSAITREGQWIGPGWIRVASSQSGRAGMLARKQEIEFLGTEIESLKNEWSMLEESNRSERDELSGMDREIDGLQQRVNELHRESSEIGSRISAGHARIGDLDERQKQIAEETTSLLKRQGHDEEQIKSLRAELASVLEEMASTEKERAALDEQRQTLLERRESARANAREARNHRHELALKTESRRASLESLRNSLQRMDTQFSQLQQRYLDLSEQIASTEDPEERHRAEMDGLLQTRVEVDQRLTAARAKMQQLEEDFRQLDAARQNCVVQVEEIRSTLEKARRGTTRSRCYRACGRFAGRCRSSGVAGGPGTPWSSNHPAGARQSGCDFRIRGGTQAQGVHGCPA